MSPDHRPPQASSRPAATSGDGRYQVYLDAESEAQPARMTRESTEPFRIALLGDFGGGGGLGPQGSEGPITSHTVDRDDLDEVLRRLKPTVSMVLDEDLGPLTVSFDSIWDFHPEELVAKLPLFRELRARIESSTAQSRAEPSGGEPAAGPPPPPAAGKGVLDAVLSATDPADRGLSAPPADDLAGLIEQAVAPYLIKPDADAHARRSAYEASATDVLRAILRDPSYRALESLWRGLYLLTQRLDTGPHLKIHLVELPKARLRREVQAERDGAGSALSDLLFEAGPGSDFALLAGCYAFDATQEDLSLLQALGEIGQRANAPWILEGTAELAGLALGGGLEGTSLRTNWEALRESAGAAYLSLLMPRFRQRLPFSPTEGDDPPFFVELTGTGGHDDHLWGSPVFLGAAVLGQAFSRHGWQLRPAAPWDLSGLPLLVTKEDGIATAHPCAEVLFSEGDARSLIEAGITPLLAAKEQDRVRVPGVHPVAQAPFPLAGRWLGS